MDITILFSLLLLFVHTSVLFSYDNYLYTKNDYQRYADHLDKNGYKQQALSYCKKMLEIDPNDLYANDKLFCSYFNQGDYTRAKQYMANILPALFRSDRAHFHMGLVCLNLGEVYEAIDEFKRTLSLNNGHQKAHYKLGQAYFKVGNLKKARREFKIIEQFSSEKGVVYRTCSNTSLAGKTVLIKGEGGMGDVFFWMRYIKVLKEKERGVKIIFQVRNALVPIISLCPYVDKVISKKESAPSSDFEFFVGYLYKFYKTNVDTIPAPVGYVHAYPQLVEQWKKYLSRDKKIKIGICWDPQSYVNPKTKKRIKNNRSMPLFYFYPLSKIEHISLYSLQRKNGMDQLASMPRDFRIHVFDENFDRSSGSFMDSAAVMKNLDLIITVDTSVAHLAGALGVPVWMITPYVSDMRWFINRSDCPWYPTMRLFRQKEEGNWESAIQEILRELTLLVGN